MDHDQLEKTILSPRRTASRPPSASLEATMQTRTSGSQTPLFSSKRETSSPKENLEDDGIYEEEIQSSSTHPLPLLPAQNHGAPPVALTRSMNERGSTVLRSGVDWIVPLDDKPVRQRTVAERLDATLSTAVHEKNKYAVKAKLTGWSLNIAIGLQVLLGTLTTGLSVVTTGKQTSIMTAILGGLATVVASYLAKTRGSNEPELSIARVKDLEQFIRECEVFKLDHGHNLGNAYDADLTNFRKRFEELLGNGDGERRLSPPV